jgi:hypothetical protein
MGYLLNLGLFLDIEHPVAPSLTQQQDQRTYVPFLWGLLSVMSHEASQPAIIVRRGTNFDTLWKDLASAGTYIDCLRCCRIK